MKESNALAPLKVNKLFDYSLNNNTTSTKYGRHFDPMFFTVPYNHFSYDSTQTDNRENCLDDVSSKPTTVEQEALQSQTQILTSSCQADTQLAKEIFVKNFIQLLRESEFEFGYTTPADDYLKHAIVNYGTFAREWINHIFVSRFSDSSIIIAILRVISHFEYNQMIPQGMTMATSAMVHKDIEVKECGIRCFENWEAPENIDILKSVNISEEWLNEYLQDVIRDLECINQ